MQSLQLALFVLATTTSSAVAVSCNDTAEKGTPECLATTKGTILLQRQIKKADCVDIQPPFNWPKNTCQSQQAAGNCDKPWIVNGGLCEKLCGRCQADCVDIQPPSNWPKNTCQSQQAAGNCDKPWMLRLGYCAKLCGRCQASSSPATPVPPPVAPTECKPWCGVNNCNWKLCSDCAFCHATPVPPTVAPTEDPTVPPTPPYPAAKGYGPHYFSKGETIPSWYGLKCLDWCTDPSSWKAIRCTWGTCNGCLELDDGGDACEIPKYVSGKKNVLLLLTDDLNIDVETYQYGHPQAYTPNIKKLSESGTRFDLAYTVHPICQPSRASLLTGIYGMNSLNMYDAPFYENTILSKSRTFVEMFKLNGYYTVGTGKIGHAEKPGMFEVWGHDPNYGPIWRKDGKNAAHPTVKEPLGSYGAIDLSFGRLSTAKDFITDTDGTDVTKSGWTYNSKGANWPMRYVSDDDRDRTPDEMNADFAIKQLETNVYMQHASWFMAVGFVRPHTPLHAPDKYFDFFPLEDVTLGEAYGIKVDDYKDTNFNSPAGKEMYEKVVESYGEEHGLKLVTQAYLACVYAMDDQVGRVLTSLEETGFSDNTIVVFTSDHGWHNGQKQVFWKNTPWENAAGIPLIIKDPDYQPNQVQFPVSIIDIYPTLMDLAGLELTNTLIEPDGHVPDGYSLKPFMADASFTSFERRGAITMIGEFSNRWAYVEPQSTYQWNPKLFTMAVRMKDYRYIMVKDGTEELYHNADDPYEWKNLLFTPDMRNETTQQIKTEAIDVLNSEFSELQSGMLDAERDPLQCSSPQWVQCK